MAICCLRYCSRSETGRPQEAIDRGRRDVFLQAAAARRSPPAKRAPPAARGCGRGHRGQSVSPRSGRGHQAMATVTALSMDTVP